MSKLLLILLLFILPLNSYAIDKDKQEHFIAGVYIGAAATVVTGSWKAGHRIGCAIGLLKEVADQVGQGTPEIEDFLYTCVGSILSSYTTHRLIMYRDKHKTYVGLYYEF